MSKFCTQCGFQNSDTSDFCSACGSKLVDPIPAKENEIPQFEQQPMQQPVSQPMPTQQQVQQPIQQPRKSKNGTAVIIIVAVISFFLIIALIFGVGHYITNSWETPKSTDIPFEFTDDIGEDVAEYKPEDYTKFDNYRFVADKNYTFDQKEAKENDDDFVLYHADHQTNFSGLTESLQGGSYSLEEYKNLCLIGLKKLDNLEIVSEKKIKLGRNECYKLEEKATEDYTLVNQYIFVTDKNGYAFTLVYFDDTLDAIDDAEQMLSTLIFHEA